MRSRKLNCLLLAGALLALALLPGCRLAREEAGQVVDAPTEDALCGVLVTDEYLDLMDMEAFLRDHPEAMAGGTVSPEDVTAYGGRIYAQVTEETLTNSSGETIPHKTYTFPIEGARMLCVLRERDEDGVPNTLVINQGDMADVDTDVIQKDGESVYRMEGTVYYPAGARMQLYCNPVYQDAEGRLYVTSGTGSSSSDGTGGSGMGISMSQTVRESRTVTTGDGETEAETVELVIHAATRAIPVETVLHAYDETGAPLSTQSFAADAPPEELTLPTGTAFAVAEHRGKDAAGGPVTEWEILQPEAEGLTAWQETQGRIAPVYVTLNWP